MTSSQPLTISIAGLGTVGAGVMRLLTENAELIERRAGRAIRVVAVSARDRRRDRGVDLGPCAGTRTPRDGAPTRRSTSSSS